MCQNSNIFNPEKNIFFKRDDPATGNNGKKKITEHGKKYNQNIWEEYAFLKRCKNLEMVGNILNGYRLRCTQLCWHTHTHTETPPLSLSCVDMVLGKVCVYVCVYVLGGGGLWAPHRGPLWSSAHEARLNGLFLHLCKPGGVPATEATPHRPLTSTSDLHWIWSGGAFQSPCAHVQSQKWLNCNLCLTPSSQTYHTV